MFPVPETLVRLASAALPVVVDTWVKGAVVLAAAWAVTRLMHRASAASRHFVWTAAFAGLLALPVLSMVVPAWRVPVPRALQPLMERPAAEPVVAAVVTPSPWTRGPVKATVHYDAIAVPATATPAPAHARPVRRASVDTIWTPRAAQPAVAVIAYQAGAPAEPTIALARQAAAGGGVWMIGYWLAGALFILGGLLRGRWQVARMGARAQRVRGAAWIDLAQSVAERLGIRRPVTLLRSASAGVPVTWGAVYPVVLLPADADDWTAERKNAVLVHEMAHVTRFDVVTQFLAQLATAIHWPNPLAWVAMRHLRSERERACDDQVLAAGATASAYAGDLLEIVRSLGSGDRPALAALAMAHRSDFEGRLLAILDPRQSRRGVSRVTGALTVAGALALIVPLAAMRPATGRAGDRSAPQVAPAARASRVTDTVAIPVRTRFTDTVVVARASTAPVADNFVAAWRTLDSAIAQVSTASPVAEATTALVAAVPARGCDLRALQRSMVRKGRPVLRNQPGTHIAISDDRRCLAVDAIGRITYTDDERDVAELSPGGYLSIADLSDGVERRIDFSPVRGGGVLREYFVEGEQRELDDEGRRWLASVLSDLARETADAEPRARRLYERGGADAVFEEARRIASDDSKAGYYRVLLDVAGDDRRLMERVLREAGKGIASDGTKAALLAEVSRRHPRDAAVNAALVQASTTIASDGERRRVLSGMVQGDDAAADRATLVRVARSAATLASDGEKAELMLEIADLYVNDDSLRSVLLRTTATIASDMEKSRVLLALLDRPGAGTRVKAELLAVAQTVASDMEKARVLTSFAEGDSLTAEPVRRAFFDAVGTIASDMSKQEVLSAVLRRRPPLAVTAAALRATRGIASDMSKATVLVEAASLRPLDETVRDLILDAAETLSSGMEFRRVTTALVRSPRASEQ